MYELLWSLCKKQSAQFCRFSTLFKDLADDIDQTRGQWDKLFIRTFPSSKPKLYFNSSRALSCLETDLQMLLICRLKLSWSSMCISSNVTDEATSTLSLLIKNCLGLLVWLLLWMTIDLNLPVVNNHFVFRKLFECDLRFCR